MDTKNNPDPNGCYNRAEPDEPRFTLLGRDKAAPAAIRYWALERLKLGKNKPDDPQILDAFAVAKAMVAHREGTPVSEPVTEGADLV